MNTNSVWSWIVGIVVLVLIIGGLVWWTSDHPQATTAGTDTTATTTSDTGTPVGVSDKSSMTVAQVVASLGGASEYQGLFNSSGIGATLIGTQPSSYTVFVSTDQGFGLLAPGTISNMTAAEKKRMVQYSVVSGRALDVHAVDSGTIQTLSGDTLNFHVGSTGLVQVNSSFALAAYKAKNGIVYVINQPLLPPQQK